MSVSPRYAEPCLSSEDHIQPDAAPWMRNYVVLTFHINEQLCAVDRYLVDAYYSPPA